MCLQFKIVMAHTAMVVTDKLSDLPTPTAAAMAVVATVGN
jgi:hypothetical protein